MDTEILSVCSLVVAGMVGGALNSVAGGGSFVVFPTLVFAGVSPVSANATTTLGLWPASAASAFGYRRELPKDRRLVVVLALASLVGGLAGAMLLLDTSDATFERLIPWLIGVAAALFSFGPRIQARLGLGRPSAASDGAASDGAASDGTVSDGTASDGTASVGAASDGEPLSTRGIALGALVQLVIATYGGYFGGGMGILMLATFSLVGLSNMHAMNGLKNILGTVLNGVAILAFLWAGQIQFMPALAVALGGVAGGYGGASMARKLPAAQVRIGVTLFAWSMAVYFAWRAYG